jgi:hypothetical protein
VLGGEVIWSPGLDGALLVSQRGGDFLLSVGQDWSVGYTAHDAESVQLYLEETLTFRAIEPDAVIVLAEASARKEFPVTNPERRLAMTAGSGFTAGSGGRRRRLAKNGRAWRNASDHTANVWPSPGITTEQVAMPAAWASGTSCWMAW